MEQLPYSLEKAQDEAEQMQALKKADSSLSYAEAHTRVTGPAKKADRVTGKYEKDAGHAAEEMLVELFDDMPDIFSYTELSSAYDDQKATDKKIDLILTLAQGGKIALQLSETEDKNKMRQKLGELIKYPLLTELHDDNGNVTLREDIPRALLGVDKTVWGNALNKALADESDSMITALPKKERVHVLERMIESLKLAKQYRVDKSPIFDDRIKKLEKGLSQQRTQL